MSNKKIGAVFFLLLISVSIASALEVEVHADPLSDIQIRFLKDSNNYYSFGTFTKTTDVNGVVTFSIEIPDSTVNIIIREIKLGKETFEQLYESQSSNGKLVLDISDYKGNNGEQTLSETNSTNVSATTLEAQAGNVTNVTNSSQVPITGEVVNSNVPVISNLTYYIIGGVLFIAIVGFLIAPRIKSKFSGSRPPHESPSLNNPVRVSPKVEQVSSSADRMKELESKIRESQEALDSLKKQETIQEVQARLERDIRELERLRRS